MRRTHLTAALLVASILAIGGCSKDPAPTGESTVASEAAVPAAQSVPDLLDNTDGVQIVAEALKETGIAGIFKGKGSYTLLAPEDIAFEQLGDTGKALTESEDHAALAALLKDHLIPGYLTPQDISAAIDASKDGQVSMTSVSGKELVFTKSGAAITASAPDGSEAKIDGAALAGGSSVAIPVTAILRKL